MQNFISSSDLLYWNIVLKGNNAKSITTDKGGNLKIRPPVTAEGHQHVQREEKARAILLSALPDEHMEEGLDKGYDKMQKILSQMNTLKIKLEPKDVNIKFLRGLPPSWSGIALILKTKGGLEYISFDDRYNKLKFLEIETKGYSLSSSTLSNAAFVSTAGSSQGKLSYQESRNGGYGSYNTTLSASPGSSSSKGSSKSKCSVVDDVIYSFFANHEIDQQLVYEDLDQINKKEFKEENARFDKKLVKCFKCKKMGHFSRECRAQGGQNSNNYQKYKEAGKDETDSKAMVVVDGNADSEGEVVSADDAIPAGDVAAAVVSPHSKTEFALMCLSTELAYEEKIRVLSYELEEKSNILEYRQKLIDQATQEKHDLMTNLDNELANQAKWNNSGNYMPPSNIPDIDESHMVYGKKATDSSKIKTNDDSISHSHDSVLSDFNDSVSAPASESSDTIVIDCARQEDFPNVCTSSIETNVKSSETFFSAGRPNSFSADRPNPVSAGQPNTVSAGDGILGPQPHNIQPQNTYFYSFTHNNQQIIFLITHNFLYSLYLTGGLNGKTAVKPSAVFISTGVLFLLLKYSVPAGEYDIWAMKMQNFISSSDLLCWNIVLKGNNAKSMTTDKGGNLKIRPPVTAEGHQHARFGGNAESKKLQKSLLKQKFKEFKISEEEGLDKGYDKMQKILSQMNTLKIKLEPKDVNIKFLRGLPPSWSEIETKGYSSSSSTLSNAAFVSTAGSSQGKLSYQESGNDGYGGYTTTLSASPGSSSSKGSSKSKCSVVDDVIYSFFANHEMDQQLVYEDLDQINKEEFKEECQAQGGQNRNNYQKYKEARKDETDSKAMVVVDGSIDRDKQTKEGNTEPKSLENFGMVAGLEIASDADSEGEVVSTDDAIPAGVSVSAGDVAAAVVSPHSETEFALMCLSTEDKWNNSGKNLYKLIDSSMSVRTKRGLGLDKYIGEGELGIDDSKFSIFHTTSDELEGQPIYSRFASFDHMKAVPPPLTGNYMPPSNIPDIDESHMVYGKKAIDSSEIKTNDDSISHSHDSVLSDFNDSVSAPASESSDTIVIDCARQEDFPNVYTSISAGRPNSVSADRPNPITAGQPNIVSAGDGILGLQPHNIQPQNTYFYSFTHNNQQIIFLITHNFLYSLYLTGGLNGKTAVKPSAGWPWIKYGMSKTKGSKINGGLKSKSWSYAKGLLGRPKLEKAKDKGIVDSGYSRSMLGNKDKLEDFENFHGGEVTFRGSTGKITRKGTIKTKNLNFENVLYTNRKPVNPNRPKPVSAGRPKPVFAGRPNPISAGQPNPISADQPNPVSAGQPNPISADQPNPVSAGQPNTVSDGDGILGLGLLNIQSKSTYFHSFTYNNQQIFFPITHNSLYSLYLTGGLNGKTAVMPSAGWPWTKYGMSKTKGSKINGGSKSKSWSFAKGTGKAWMFDIDYLTDSLNYSRVSSTNLTAGSQGATPSNAGSQKDDSDSDDEPDVLIIQSTLTLVVPIVDEATTQNDYIKSDFAQLNADNLDELSELQALQKQEQAGKEEADRLGRAFSSLNPMLGVGTSSISSSGFAGSTPQIPTGSAGRPVSVGRPTGFAGRPISAGFPRASSMNKSDIHDGLTIFDCPKSGIFTSSSYDEDFSGPDANNLESSLNVSSTITKRIHNIHPNSQALANPDWVEAMQAKMQQFKNQKVWVLIPLPDGKRAIRTKWILKNKRDARGIVCRNKARFEAIRLFLAFASFIGFMVYQMDMKSAFIYENIAKEVYVTQPRGFEDPDHPKKVYKVVKALYGLHQAPRAWYERLSTFLLKHGYRRGNDWCEEFKTLMQSEFEMSSMGPLSFFLGLQVDQRPDGIFIYQEKSMIGCLMYLTATRPDIMFAVYAAARHQVTPKTSNLFSVNDYAGAHGDRKSTTGGCQFLGKRLISWQCQKQTTVATSSCKAEYMAVASCCGQWFLFTSAGRMPFCWLFLILADDLVSAGHILFMMVIYYSCRDANEKKLIQVLKIPTENNVADLLTKSFDVTRFSYLVVHIVIPAGDLWLLVTSAGRVIFCWLIVIPAGDSGTSSEVSLPDSVKGLVATIDGTSYTVTEASIRSALQLDDLN
nr:hypothetical protein [Tanacetum cinerariifolium]